MSVQDFIAIITALGTLGGLWKFIQWAITETRTARQEQVEEAVKRALQEERAERYKAESAATIAQKNVELEQKTVELKRAGEEIQRLQAKDARQTDIIDRLARSFETLSERVAS